MPVIPFKINSFLVEQGNGLMFPFSAQSPCVSKQGLNGHELINELEFKA